MNRGAAAAVVGFRGQSWDGLPPAPRLTLLGVLLTTLCPHFSALRLAVSRSEGISGLS